MEDCGGKSSVKVHKAARGADTELHMSPLNQTEGLRGRGEGARGSGPHTGDTHTHTHTQESLQ